MLRNFVVAAATLACLTASVPQPHGERLVRVYGDLATADHVAIYVPGSDTTVATFDDSFRRPGGAARALLAEAARLAPSARVAVVAWLGYDSPRMLSLDAVTDGAAAGGAAALRRTVADLRTRTSAPITLLCHSYGSVVCAEAAPGLPVSQVAVFGSPGLGVAGRTGFWVGRGAQDLIKYVPHIKLGPLGFGADPMETESRIFDAGPGGHSDYFRPGGVSLRNLTLITLGRTGEVTRG